MKKNKPLLFCLLFLLGIFIDKQCKAVSQGAEMKATQASYLGWFDSANIDIMQSTM